jgi:purine-binding chemotaxis protein CheW
LRGQIVTAIDLRCRLGLKPRANSNACMNVVLRDGEGCVSLLVDEIGDVFNVDSSKFEAPPSTTNSKGRDLIVGAYKLPDRLLLVLNTNRVIDEVERHAETKLA